MVYITGDIHGSTKRIIKFANQMQLTKDDIIIILGDVGINYFQDERDSFSKAALSHIKPIIFCIHGNHEMRPETISTYKVVERYNNLVYIEDEYPNIAFAIDAYKQIADNHTAFVIVGDGEEMASLRAKAVGCKSIIFTGRLEGNELYAWYNVAQVFTLPSTLEPFGAVTNEALQGGCFALVSRLAGSNCLVANDVNGFVIDPYDAAGFVEALKAAFSRCEQLTLPLVQRKSKMLESFNDYFLKLVSNL